LKQRSFNARRGSIVAERLLISATDSAPSHPRTGAEGRPSRCVRPLLGPPRHSASRTAGLS